MGYFFYEAYNNALFTVVNLCVSNVRNTIFFVAGDLGTMLYYSFVCFSENLSKRSHQGKSSQWCLSFTSNKVEEHFMFVILTMEFLSQHFVLKDKTLIMYWTAILVFSNIAKGLDDRIKVSVLPLIQLY